MRMTRGQHEDIPENNEHLSLKGGGLLPCMNDGSRDVPHLGASALGRPPDTSGNYGRGSMPVSRFDACIRLLAWSNGATGFRHD